jgi:enamine deaminase RidA (YjgF/YER057c/UK114 family)
MVYISGQLPLDENGEVVGARDWLTQARQVFHNIELALQAAGATPADVVKLGFYLMGFDDLSAIRQARDEFLAGANPPASTLMQIDGLIESAARLEVDAVAIVAD